MTQAVKKTWSEVFPGYTRDNLETEGAVEIPHLQCFFVHTGHPVAALLRNNPELIGYKLDDGRVFSLAALSPFTQDLSFSGDSDEWFKVDRDVMRGSCETLRRHVIGVDEI